MLEDAGVQTPGVIRPHNYVGNARLRSFHELVNQLVAMHKNTEQARENPHHVARQFTPGFLGQPARVQAVARTYGIPSVERAGTTAILPQRLDEAQEDDPLFGRDILRAMQHVMGGAVGVAGQSRLQGGG